MSAERDLVLLGGGHTHVLLIRKLAMRPIAGVRVTLISEQTLTPYSGMLPGFVAGHYSRLETHIDLNRLCQWAGVNWIKARVSGLDANKKIVFVEDRDDVVYDRLSIDTGSTPDLSVPGAREFAVGVKPVSGFAGVLRQLLSASETHRDQQWGVVGAGAGGVELVLALAQRLGDTGLQLHLIYNGKHILPGYPPKLRSVVQRALAHYGISEHPGFRVDRVSASGVHCVDRLLSLGKSIWCTGASPPDWLATSALACGERGFIAVNQHLQSTSHADVFACGDIADMIADPRPKAGVYAVRQAPVLDDNLRRISAGKPLREARLQTDFLSLLSLGEKTAVGCRFGWVARGRWVWKLKDHIDQKFMQRINDPGPKPQMASPATDVMHCAGCGSKLGPQLVAENISSLPRYDNLAVTPALDVAEDAALWNLPAASTVVQSIDGFRSFSSDLERFGEICVYHALSDLYAMGAKPVSAQVWINLAHSHPRLQRRDHRRLMAGIAAALLKEQTVLAGGHSTEGSETHVAVVANGLAVEKPLWKKHGLHAGQLLVLTKPLGTGVVLAADMQAQAPANAVEAAFDSMLTSNRFAAQALAKLTPSAVTDVTGFGLLGHLLEMLQPQKLGARIQLPAVPLLSGALELSGQGFKSTLYPQLAPYLSHCELQADLPAGMLDLVLDPQTSGGLLLALEPQMAEPFAAQCGASIIGCVTESGTPLTIGMRSWQ